MRSSWGACGSDLAVPKDAWRVLSNGRGYRCRLSSCHWHPAKKCDCGTMMCTRTPKVNELQLLTRVRHFHHRESRPATERPAPSWDHRLVRRRRVATMYPNNGMMPHVQQAAPTNAATRRSSISGMDQMVAPRPMMPGMMPGMMGAPGMMPQMMPQQGGAMPMMPYGQPGAMPMGMMHHSPYSMPQQGAPMPYMSPPQPMRARCAG